MVMVVTVTVALFHFLLVVQVGQFFETELVLHLIHELTVVSHHLLESRTVFDILTVRFLHSGFFVEATLKAPGQTFEAEQACIEAQSDVLIVLLRRRGTVIAATRFLMAQILKFLET